PVVINGTSKLVYELHLTNFSQTPFTLKCVSVLEQSIATQIMKVCDEALSKRLSLKTEDQRTINPAMHAVVYLEVENALEKMPEALKHRIEYKNKTSEDSDFVEGSEVVIQKEPILVLETPLAGGPWAAIYEPSWERGHRRVFYATDGHAHLPGRFAIDFIKLDDQGRYSNGNEDQISNWYGHGIDVLAVADARVVSIRDNIQESKTISGNPKHKLEDGAGNYIVLDLGNGYFAFYEHLKPGSILVKSGDHVSTGQKIASLGFTGDSTGPHLHFHLADHNSTLASEGLPYHFKSFTVLGSYDSLNDFGKKLWKPINDSSDPVRKMEFPAPNVVVRFK
ncbi:MAG TPA: M23 family metallopeptidase, partial [Acidobacteriota bacterium]|nr:M23 family metallopeptidase [Acidobacteriota bacterium]